MLSDSDFLRYSRQLLLEEVGIEGQQALGQASVLIVGLGGLGAPAALYLAAAGVGTLWLADDDQLHISNLQRQILYRSAETGQPKALLAQQHLQALNPQITLHTLNRRMDEATLAQTLPDVDLVLDCSDNMATRQAVNAACVRFNRPLVSASVVGFSGQLLVLVPPWQQGCYHCLWGDESEPQRNCRTAGILGPIAGVMGSLQALEAIKLLSGHATPLAGQLRLFDGREQTWRTLNLQANAHCPVCGGHA
ncbi:HesA/MoeB/ThiF family protein [[Erwinia] mediterraneensis]|uniref:HesA/MoeB/ThiF family protein n=1 Tax=[Erwinia] mediterraneensis TaxID=2161819 RepID=UPI0010310C37|nr:HesA/MoeB/ThiF family protein [[Erwinia] mediterraneensis]